MNVQALLHAGVGGVADRGRQAIARLIDRCIVLLQPQVRRWPAHLAPDARSAPVSVDPTRFFAGVSEDLAAFNARFPLERARTVASTCSVIADSSSGLRSTGISTRSRTAARR